MINLCNTLLPNEMVHALLADIRKTITPIPVIDRNTEVDIVPIIQSVSTDTKIVFRVLQFLDIFFDL